MFDPLDPRPSPHEVAENRAMQEAIERILSEMPSEIGALIREHYVDGASYAALAKRCGCRAGALRMRLRREMQRARERLQSHGWGIHRSA
jgi:DNA-directed RNA polymerase specialized sigma24 family protein